jgi:hypothetical protein
VCWNDVRPGGAWGVLIGPQGESLTVGLKSVSAGFFDAAGIPLLAGRGIEEQDEPWATGVVSESLARRLASDPQGAIGAVLRTSSRSLVVVGVVADTHDVSLETRTSPTLYRSFREVSPSGLVHYVLRGSERPILLS